MNMIEIALRALGFGALIYLAGYFRGWQDIIWFKPKGNQFHRFAMKHPIVAVWYEGHKSIFDALGWTGKEIKLWTIEKGIYFSIRLPKWLRYDPRFLIFCDPWHLAKKFEMLSVSFAFCLFVGWWGLLYYGFYGVSFYLNYHYIQPIDPDGNLWHFMTSIFRKHHSAGE